MSTTLEKGGEYTKSICDSDLFNSIWFQIKLIKKLILKTERFEPYICAPKSVFVFLFMTNFKANKVGLG
nr:hypothetical protein [Mycoplasmopsis bovis]